MPKHGQHQIDHPGRNDPSKSQEITTGTYKKQETFREQAAQHEDPGKAPQHTKVPHADPLDGRTVRGTSRVRMQAGETRSGSESNAHRGRKRSAHDSANAPQPGPHTAEATEEAASFDRDLHPDYMAGQNAGIAGPHPEKTGHTAYDIKALHERLSGLTGEQLRAITVMPEGSRLEQGATYLDLTEPERGEFVAMGSRVAEHGHYLVPKSEIDYQLWNRLIGVTLPARLGEE